MFEVRVCFVPAVRSSPPFPTSAIPEVHRSPFNLHQTPTYPPYPLSSMFVPSLFAALLLSLFLSPVSVHASCASSPPTNCPGTIAGSSFTPVSCYVDSFPRWVQSYLSPFVSKLFVVDELDSLSLTRAMLQPTLGAQLIAETTLASSTTLTSELATA